MTDPAFPSEASADLPGVAFGPMRQVLLHQVSEHGLTLREDAPGRLTVETSHGLIGLRAGDHRAVAGHVAARDSRDLFVMKSAVVEQLRTVFPDAAEAMRWSDVAGDPVEPPNFQRTRVLSVARLGRSFLRMRLQAVDLSAYDDASIHFRFVLPPPGVAPEWPTVAPNGSTRWPAGPAAPHKPVYTVRHADVATATLEVDIFEHDGGRATDWARGIMAGTDDRRIVGMVGPGGGGLVDAQTTLIATDETGFPAAARIVEGLPEGARAEVILESGHGTACDYPFAGRAGVHIRWLDRSRGDSLRDAALAALSRHPDSVIWFAGERDAARDIRAAARAAGLGPKTLRISGFWSSAAGG